MRIEQVCDDSISSMPTYSCHVMPSVSTYQFRVNATPAAVDDIH